MARRGHVVIPHGFGMIYDGKVHGVNVNRLTKNTNRDWLGHPCTAMCPVESKLHDVHTEDKETVRYRIFYFLLP